MTEPAANGAIVVDKPGGMTSHDVVNRIRRLYGTKRVGHAGTLDPLATGVLVVCLGEATRVIEYMETEPKEYVAGVTFGMVTDSQDVTGTVLEERGSPALTGGAVDAILPAFRGDVQQVPPMVSAVRHEGKRLYELARRGVEVERAPRPITVHALEADAFEPGEHATCTMRVVCSSGTYVRTLVHDIGAKLGCGAAMSSLRRIRVGRYAISSACNLRDLADDVVRAQALMPVSEALSHLPRSGCGDAALDLVAHGQPVDAPVDWPDGALGCLLDGRGRVVGLARRNGDRLQPTKVFASVLAESGRSTQAT